ncbi:MAG: hypothetical protein Q8910_00300 [Bacteroidota bacterium]|nr:hypothetical protein [Bacteroidota bacterium]
MSKPAPIRQSVLESYFDAAAQEKQAIEELNTKKNDRVEVQQIPAQTPIIAENDVDVRIAKLPPPSGLQFRLPYKKRSIINVLSVELQEFAKLPGDNRSLIGRLALDVLEDLHDTCDNFREKISIIASEIEGIPTKEEKERVAYECLKNIIREIYKK